MHLPIGVNQLSFSVELSFGGIPHENQTIMPAVLSSSVSHHRHKVLLPEIVVFPYVVPVPENHILVIMQRLKLEKLLHVLRVPLEHGLLRKPFMVDLLNDVVVFEFYSVVDEGVGREFMKVEMLWCAGYFTEEFIHS